MKIEIIKLSKLKRNPTNPRILKDDKFAKLTQSIKDFPQMLEIRPIVVNDDMVVLGGNMRLKACKEAGLKEVPVIKVNDLTEEQQREFIIKDNVGFGEWDWDLLANDWEIELLKDWGLDIPIEDDDEEKEIDDLSDDIGLSLRLEIEFTSESEQEKLFNELTEQGYKCRLLTL
jgi:ParB-like chromosome segregation protein Spo0J